MKEQGNARIAALERQISDIMTTMNQLQARNQELEGRLPAAVDPPPPEDSPMRKDPPAGDVGANTGKREDPALSMGDLPLGALGQMQKKPIVTRPSLRW